MYIRKEKLDEINNKNLPLAVAGPLMALLAFFVTAVSLCQVAIAMLGTLMFTLGFNRALRNARHEMIAYEFLPFAALILLMLSSLMQVSALADLLLLTGSTMVVASLPYGIIKSELGSYGRRKATDATKTPKENEGLPMFFISFASVSAGRLLKIRTLSYVTVLGNTNYILVAPPFLLGSGLAALMMPREEYRFLKLIVGLMIISSSVLSSFAILIKLNEPLIALARPMTLLPIAAGIIATAYIALKK